MTNCGTVDRFSAGMDTYIHDLGVDGPDSKIEDGRRRVNIHYLYKMTYPCVESSGDIIFCADYESEKGLQLNAPGRILGLDHALKLGGDLRVSVGDSDDSKGYFQFGYFVEIDGACDIKVQGQRATIRFPSESPGPAKCIALKGPISLELKHSGGENSYGLVMLRNDVETNLAKVKSTGAVNFWSDKKIVVGEVDCKGTLGIGGSGISQTGRIQALAGAWFSNYSADDCINLMHKGNKIGGEVRLYAKGDANLRTRRPIQLKSSNIDGDLHLRCRKVKVLPTNCVNGSISINNHSCLENFRSE